MTKDAPTPEDIPEAWQQFPARWRKALLARADGCSVEEAGAHAGVTRRTIYMWRKADAEFKAAWDEATDAGVDELEAILDACAKKSKNDPRYQTSLIFSLKNRRPTQWRDAHDLRHSGQVSVVASLAEMTPEELARLEQATGDDTEAGQ
jgi:hypothetical protein